jgi:hypothetical protein
MLNSRRLRDLEHTAQRVTERIEKIRDVPPIAAHALPPTPQTSQQRALTPQSPTSENKRPADIFPDRGQSSSAFEVADTCRLRKRRRSTHGSSTLQTHVTGDGTKAHHFFGSTSELVFLDSVREYVQQLGYELPTSGALWSPSSETANQDSVQSNLPAELRSQLPPQSLGAKLLEVYSTNVQAHTPMLYWPSILIKFQRIYTRSPSHYEDRQIMADFCILMMVWAVGSQMSDFAEVGHGSGHQMRNGWKFFEAARKHHSHCLIKSTYTLDDAIISLLMSIYLMGASLPSPCWVMTGITSRIVQDLGLHKRPSPHQLFNVEIESRNRLFWGAYMVDRIVALTCGRPVSLLDEDCDVDLPGQVDNKGTTAPESLDFFRASISVVYKLDAIIQLGAIPFYEESDIETMKKLDAQLFECWQRYPGGLTDESEQGSLEPSTLKLIFVGQQARLALFSRHFTDGTLNPTMRNFCLKKSVEISRVTARIMLRVARGANWEHVFSHRCNDMVCTHIFRASIVLLLAYRLTSTSGDGTADNQAITLSQHIIILWHSLRAAAKAHISAAKSLELLQVFADTLNFDLHASWETSEEPTSRDEANAPSQIEADATATGPVETYPPILVAESSTSAAAKTVSPPLSHNPNIVPPTPASISTGGTVPASSSQPVEMVAGGLPNNGHGGTVVPGGKSYTSPNYGNFDPTDIHWEMLQGLLNCESQFGMYLGGSNLNDDLSADF